MGNQLGVGGSLPDFPSLLVDASSSLCFRRSLGGGKVLKTLLCLHANGSVVVKMYVRRMDAPADLQRQLDFHERDLHALVQRLQPCPVCLLPFTHVQISARAAFLLRPYLADNLYERFHTRPFLRSLEKRWLAYMLLRALDTLNQRNVCHGDLKSENVLLTTYGWVVLADLASYKPTLLPHDNPADFHFFFDAGQRRRCYVAPERFLDVSSTAWTHRAQAKLKPAMDIFSCGCVLAEIWLEGEPLFDLPQLLAYKEGRYEPRNSLKKIEDRNARDLITHMIALDPASRLSAWSYLGQYAASGLFPPFFDHLYAFMSDLQSPSMALPDTKIDALRSRYSSLLLQVVPAAHRAATLKALFDGEMPRAVPAQTMDSSGGAVQEQEDLHEPNSGYEILVKNISSQLSNSSMESIEDGLLPDSGSVEEVLPLITMVCSCIRSVRRPTYKLRCLDTLESLTHAVSDEVRLDRIVPYLVAMCSDGSALVRATAVRLLTSILSMVENVSTSEAHVFPEYIFPSLSMLPNDPEEIVRVAFAENIARLADTARRFLDISNFTEQMPVRGLPPSTGFSANDSRDKPIPYQGSYDSDLAQLHNLVCRLVGDSLNTSSSKVKIAILGDISRLAIFFGRERANSWLLPMLITVLNDRDWELRSAFFENIAGLSVFVGRASLQNFIMPCIEQALFDSAEFVIVRAIEALISLVELGLFEHRVLIDVCGRICPFLCHPSIWIRRRALDFVASMASVLGPAKAFWIMTPRLAPFIRTPHLYEITRESLMQCLKAPLTRKKFTEALSEPAEATDELLQAMSSFLEGISAAAQHHRKHAGDTPRSKRTRAAHRVRAQSTTVAAQLYAVEVAHSVPHAVRRAILVEQFPTQSPASLSSRPASSSSSPHLAAASAGSDLPDSPCGSPKSVAISAASGPGAADSAISGPTCAASGSCVSLSARTLAMLDTLLHSNSQSVPIQQESAADTQEIAVRLSPASLSPNLRFALKVPPLPPDLGSVRVSSLSSSWVFGNHGPPWARRAAHPSSWRPRGLLVAELSEHRGSVNEIAVSRDNIFMASASSDGSVRIWDSNRLARSVSAASQLSYTGLGGRVSSVVVCDSSHSVAAGSSNGTVHVFRIECTTKNDGSADRYVGVTTLAQLDIAQEGGVVSVRHMSRISQSVLMVGSRHGRVDAHDLRARESCWQVRCPPSFGLLSRAEVGPSLHSLVTGSSRGFVAVYDLRFGGVPVQQWRLMSRLPVSVLRPCPSTSLLASSSRLRHLEVGPLLLVGTRGSPHLSAYDMYTGDARELYACSDDAEPDSLLPISAQPKQFGYGIEDELSKMASNPAHSSYHDGITGALCCPGSFVMTAGYDRVLRFWDVRDPPSSFRMTGNLDASDQPASSYGGAMRSGVTMLSESSSSVATTANNAASGSHEVRRPSIQHRRGPVRPLTDHKDVILDMKALEFPKKMLITASRDGRIKAWI